jgi:hypothetical protein
LALPFYNRPKSLILKPTYLLAIHNVGHHWQYVIYRYWTCKCYKSKSPWYLYRNVINIKWVLFVFTCIFVSHYYLVQYFSKLSKIVSQWIYIESLFYINPVLSVVFGDRPPMNIFL